MQKGALELLHKLHAFWKNGHVVWDLFADFVHDGFNKVCGSSFGAVPGGFLEQLLRLLLQLLDRGFGLGQILVELGRGLFVPLVLGLLGFFEGLALIPCLLKFSGDIDLPGCDWFGLQLLCSEVIDFHFKHGQVLRVVGPGTFNDVKEDSLLVDLVIDVGGGGGVGVIIRFCLTPILVELLLLQLLFQFLDLLGLRKLLGRAFVLVMVVTLLVVLVAIQVEVVGGGLRIIAAACPARCSVLLLVSGDNN